MTPESLQELQRLLLTRQPKSPDVGSITPLNPYEAIQAQRSQLSSDPVIANLQRFGRGIKGLLTPETPVEILSMFSPVKGVKPVATKIFPNFSTKKLKDISYNAPRLSIYKKSNRKYPHIVDEKGNKYDEVLFKTSFVKRIPIDDYLKLTTPSDKAIKNITTTPRIKSYGKFDVKKAIDKDSIGPFLQIDEAGKVVGHEGRTRAILAKQAGAKTMPVEIKLQRFSQNKKDFEEIAQTFYDKTKKLPEDLKHLGITKLKPQSFRGEVRKNYNYKIDKD